MKEVTITKLSTGYYYLWVSNEVWAQWPIGEPLKREHCFHPDWSWPIISKLMEGVI